GCVSRPQASNSRGENRCNWAIEYVSKNSGRIAPCISATIACSDFLQTSGKCPASFTIPPLWPPMPNAQVLQAFFDRIAFHSRQKPGLPRLGKRISNRRPSPARFRFAYRHTNHPKQTQLSMQFDNSVQVYFANSCKYKTVHPIEIVNANGIKRIAPVI